MKNKQLKGKIAVHLNFTVIYWLLKQENSARAVWICLSISLQFTRNSDHVSARFSLRYQEEFRGEEAGALITPSWSPGNSIKIISEDAIEISCWNHCWTETRSFCSLRDPRITSPTIVEIPRTIYGTAEWQSAAADSKSWRADGGGALNRKK